ncbi:MAG: hypothetical protein ACF8QF_08325 [Phycisphaerales bacterium]
MSRAAQLDARPARHRFGVGGAILALGFAAAGLAGGCATPLFPRDQPRSQYESYDAVRNQSEPRYTYDEFGRATPNLRGRLAPN